VPRGDASDAPTDVGVTDAGDAPSDATTLDVLDEPDGIVLEKPLPAISTSSQGCVVEGDGSVKCWQPEGAAQALTGFGAPVVALALGDVGFARLGDHSVWAWGSGTHCVLGTGIVNDNQPIPFRVTMLGMDIVSIATYGAQACAARSDGSVVAWGGGGNGYGKSGDACGPTPVIGLDGPASAVAQGAESGCALLVDGTIQCWGRNDKGQLGNDTTLDAPTASSPVLGINDAIAVSTSGTHACALRSNGTVRCWGDDTFGELGDGQTNTTSPVPVDVAGLNGAVAQIATAAGTTCARLASGAVECWGSNGFHMALGNGGSPATQPSPAILFDTDAAVVSLAQTISYGCALFASGGANCWGDYNGFTDAGTKLPVGIQGLP